MAAGQPGILSGLTGPGGLSHCGRAQNAAGAARLTESVLPGRPLSRVRDKDTALRTALDFPETVLVTPIILGGACIAFKCSLGYFVNVLCVIVGISLPVVPLWPIKNCLFFTGS